MTKSDLIDSVSANAKISKAAAATAIESITASVAKTLKKGGRMYMAEFASTSNNKNSKHYHVSRLEDMKIVLGSFDFKIKESKFYEDDVVYSDLAKSEELDVVRGQDKVGYRINSCIKL